MLARAIVVNGCNSCSGGRLIMGVEVVGRKSVCISS